MENQNKLEIKKGECTLQNIFNELNFDILDEIEVDELGKSDIKSIVKHLKQALNQKCDEYMNHEWDYFNYKIINFVELDKLLKSREEDKEQILEELSLLFIAMLLYSLVNYYKGRLLTNSRNDHDAFMYQTMNKFAHSFYLNTDISQGLEFAIEYKCLWVDSLNCLLYWLEFATAATKKEWTI